MHAHSHLPLLFTALCSLPTPLFLFFFRPPSPCPSLSPSISLLSLFFLLTPKQELTRLPRARPLVQLAFLGKLLMTVLVFMLTRQRVKTVQLVSKPMVTASQRVMCVALERSLLQAQRRAHHVDLGKNPTPLELVALIALLVSLKTITNASDVPRVTANQRVGKRRALSVVPAQSEQILTDMAPRVLHASCATQARIKISRDKTAAKIVMPGTLLRPPDRKLRVVIAHRASTLPAPQPLAPSARRASHQQPFAKHLLAETATLDATRTSSRKRHAKFVELTVATTRRKNIMIKLDKRAARRAPPPGRLRMLARTAATTAPRSLIHLAPTPTRSSTVPPANAHGAMDVLRDRRKSHAVQQLVTPARSVSSRRRHKTRLTRTPLKVSVGTRPVHPALCALRASIARVDCAWLVVVRQATRQACVPTVLVTSTSSKDLERRSLETTTIRATLVNLAMLVLPAQVAASLQQGLAQDGQHRQSSQSRALGSRAVARLVTRF